MQWVYFGQHLGLVCTLLVIWQALGSHCAEMHVTPCGSSLIPRGDCKVKVLRNRLILPSFIWQWCRGSLQTNCPKKEQYWLKVEQTTYEFGFLTLSRGRVLTYTGVISFGITWVSWQPWVWAFLFIVTWWRQEEVEKPHLSIWLSARSAS